MSQRSLRFVRRVAYCSLSVLFAALTLTACLETSPPPIPTSSLPVQSPFPSATVVLTSTFSPAPPTEIPALQGINLQVWHAFVGAAYDLFTAQASQFSASNEWGITVTPMAYGDYPTLFDAVQAAMMAGGTPDVVVALPEQILAWEQAGYIMDLTAYLGDLANEQAGEAALEFFPVFWDQDNINGRQLGVPAQRSGRFLFYNAAWARELGFSRPPATAEEFRRQACAANAALRRDGDVTNDGKGGWIVDTHWQTAYSWLLAFGGSVVDGTEYRFRTDPNLTALQFLKKMYDDHCAWLGETPYEQFALRLALFISGDMAEAPLVSAAFSRQGNRDEWILLPFPGSETRTVVAYGPSYAILQSTPSRQLAASLFLRWLLSPESQAQWVEATNLFPLRGSVLGMIRPYRQASLQWETAANSISLAQGVPQMASWRKVRYVLEDGMRVIFLQDTPVDRIPAVLAEMDAMAEELK